MKSNQKAAAFLMLLFSISLGWTETLGAWAIQAPPIQAPPDEAHLPDQTETVMRKSGRLKTAVRKELSKVTLPALKANNEIAFFNSMEKLLSKLDSENLEHVEAFGLASSGQSLLEKYADLKIHTIEMGQHIAQKNQKEFSSITYLAPRLIEHVQTYLDELKSHAVMRDPLTLPATWVDRNAMYWELSAVENKLLNAKKISDFGFAQAAGFAESNRDKDAAIQELEELTQLPAEIEARYKELKERETELRIEDLRESVHVLRNNKDFEQRLNAAYSIHAGVENLKRYFVGQKPGFFDRAKLNAPNLAAEITKLINEGQELGSDVSEKAALLSDGAEWWIRGRYGVGVMAGGLMKSPQALTSDSEMHRLYMPQDLQSRGTATPGNNELKTGFDRRHHHSWAVEQNLQENRLVLERCPIFNYLERKIRPQRPLLGNNARYRAEQNSIFPRLVGTLEYAYAIQAFTKLIDQSTPQQLAVYDKIFSQRNEFSFLNGMSSSGRTLAELNNLANADPKKFKDLYQQQGLAAMLALAKVELAASQTLFSEVDSAFQSMKVTEFDREPFLKLVLDGTAAHLRNLKNEPSFKRALDIDLFPEFETIAYKRRMNLIEDMLSILNQSGNEQLASVAQEYSKELEKYQKALAIKLVQVPDPPPPPQPRMNGH